MKREHSNSYSYTDRKKEIIMRIKMKATALLLVLALCIGTLAGCQGGPKATEPVPQTAATEQGTAPVTERGTTAEPAAQPGTTEEPGTTAEPAEETFLPREPGTRQLTLYWKKPGADIKTCDVWMWWEGGDGSGHLFTPCAYGMKCQVNVPCECARPERA